MEANKKRLIVILCVVVVLVAGATFAITQLRTHTEAVLVVEAAAPLRGFPFDWEFSPEHNRVNQAFGMSIDARGTLGVYMPFRGRINDFGIDARMYLHLIWYERETGNILPFEMIVDYFSQEFEPDGSVRLYNSGNHPEIEAFVNWMWEEDPYPYICDLLDERGGGWECHQSRHLLGEPQNHRWCEFRAFDHRIWYVGQTYIRQQREFNRQQRQLYGHDIQLDEFAHPHFFQLSPQMLRAFARAEADPDYPLDLTGLQRAGY